MFPNGGHYRGVPLYAGLPTLTGPACETLGFLTNSQGLTGLFHKLTNLTVRLVTVTSKILVEKIMVEMAEDNNYIPSTEKKKLVVINYVIRTPSTELLMLSCLHTLKAYHHDLHL